MIQTTSLLKTLLGVAMFFILAGGLFSCGGKGKDPGAKEPTESCENFDSRNARIDNFLVFAQELAGVRLNPAALVGGYNPDAFNDDLYCYIKQQYKKTPTLFERETIEGTNGQQVRAILFPKPEKKLDVRITLPDGNGNFFFFVDVAEKNDIPEDNNWYRNSQESTRLDFQRN